MAHPHHHLLPSNTNHNAPHPHRLDSANDLPAPFGKLDKLGPEDFREVAYEVFFTACRSSPGFSSRSTTAAAATCYGPDEQGDWIGPGPVATMRPPGVGMAVTSRVKRALGLKMLRRLQPSRRFSSCGSNNVGMGSIVGPGGPSSPKAMHTVPGSGRTRRPLTSAEIMRQQMRVTEQSDNRLRKMLMRTLVGQMGRRAETIILPLELLRHLKPSEFDDITEYHQWQLRQLRLLETGLLLHPSIPLDGPDPSATRLHDIIRAAGARPIDTSKNSDSMRTLCNAVVSLSWRAPDGGPTEVCHWADGYPLNVEIYNALLRSIFDSKDETQVLDEVDELLELMKKTWAMLGISRPIHNLCLTWVLFEQYTTTGRAEPDLLGAAAVMLSHEVAADAKRADREPVYVRMLGSVVAAMKGWTEKKLLNYHGNFDGGTVGVMEHILLLVFSCAKILHEDVPCYVMSPEGSVVNGEVNVDDLSGNRVDNYICSSARNAFAKMLEDQNVKETESLETTHRVSEVLIKLARETEELATKEKDIFSPVLKKWNPMAAGVAAVTLHSCYGTLLKQYLMGISASPPLVDETILVLQRAGKLENVLLQMVADDSVDCEDGGKSLVREMVSYEVDTIIVKLLKQWIQERLKMGKANLQRAKETETWNPKSKTEPYAHSADELVKFAKEAVQNFLEIPVNVSENLVHDLTDGLEHLFGDYITFFASCGSKQSYLPTLPPLTRCGRDSKFFKLWRRAACSAGAHDLKYHHHSHPTAAAADTHPSTSRGTQRLYIRLNTLHYLLSHLHSLEKTLSLSPKITPPKSRFGHRRPLGSSHFDRSRSALRSASRHISEVAAYRLVFLDTNPFLYASLYSGDVATSRIAPALAVLKQNLNLLCAIVANRVQPLALKEAMRAAFEAYLMVLLAGGCSRVFSRSDHAMVKEDFCELKRVFVSCGDGMIGEEEVETEGEKVAGVVELMGQPTEQLIEDFSIVACESSGIGVMGMGRKLPMPPMTGRWNRSDPNTILRVLCHREDQAADQFLKRTFQLPKRSGSG